jgi:hypothetical protein
VLIVDDFMPDKDGLAILLQGALDDVDCPNHACTEAPRLSENHAHNGCASRSGRSPKDLERVVLNTYPSNMQGAIRFTVLRS